MSEVKQKCQVDGCSRAASTRCYCCNKSVCTRHFTEHIDAVRAQVDPLADAINAMVEKTQGLTIEQLTEAPFVQLDQWKRDMYQLIDEIFSSKSEEMKNLVEKNRDKFEEHKKQQWEMIMNIQEDVKQLVEDGDATFEQIRLLRNQLASVEANLTSFQNDFLSINTRVFGQELVTVSSNLKLPFNPPVSSAKDNRPDIAFKVDLNKQPSAPSPQPKIKHNPTTASPSFTFNTPTTQSSSLFGFGGNFQPTAPVQPAFASPFSFGSTPSTSTYSGSFASTATTAANNTSFSFSNQSPTSFGSFVTQPSSTTGFTFVNGTIPTSSIFGGVAPSTSATGTNNTSPFGSTPLCGGIAENKPVTPTNFFTKRN